MYVEIGVAIISGFVGGMLREYLFKSVRGYKDARKKIAKDLIKYGNLIANPGSGTADRMAEAQSALRDDAAELRAVMDDMPAVVARLYFSIPPRDELENVEGRLIRLSNSIHSGNTLKNDKDRKRIREILKLRK